MPEPRYEKLLTVASPVDDEVAILFYDPTDPVRSHYACYRVRALGSALRKVPILYAVAQMYSEDSEHAVYHGPHPRERGLEPYAVYRVHGSDKVSGFDHEHVIICLSDSTIEFAGLSFSVSDPVEGTSAVAVLLDHVRRAEVEIGGASPGPQM